MSGGVDVIPLPDADPTRGQSVVTLGIVADLVISAWRLRRTGVG
jgi:hypothetical protein